MIIGYDWKNFAILSIEHPSNFRVFTKVNFFKKMFKVWNDKIITSFYWIFFKSSIFNAIATPCNYNIIKDPMKYV